MFRVLIGLQDKGQYETLSAAFREFFNRVHDMARRGASETAVFDTNFIEFHWGGRVYPMSMQEVTRVAVRFGFLTATGVLVEGAREPDRRDVIVEFMKADTTHPHSVEEALGRLRASRRT
jgi:hypothetical protein